MLNLQSIVFDGPQVFSPLTRYIARDQALCGLYLRVCSLDSTSVDLLLGALSTTGRYPVMFVVGVGIHQQLTALEVCTQGGVPRMQKESYRDVNLILCC